MIHNIQNLIENIHTTISFPETVSPDQIRQYARDYAEACIELNRRMTLCFNYIRNGNVAEGIRLAEMKPNLTEIYNALDFNERDEWIEIVSTLGYNVPPTLPVEQQKELSNAYLKMAPLEPLLRWHRLHALNASPIRERLAVLRAIAKIDQQNSFWREDQEAFEQIRLKELDKEIKNAIAANNFEAIQSLYAELNPTDWVSPPPSEYRQKLCTIILQNHAETLLKHFNTFSYNEAAAVYGTMQKMLTTTNMQMPQSIRQIIRAAVLWLTETHRHNELQKTFNKCAADLNDALDSESSLIVLEQLHYALLTAATQADATIPTHLEERYQAQINAHELQRSRRIKILVTAVSCACIFIGGLIMWGLTSRNFNRAVAATLATLQQIENEQRYDDILTTLQQIEQQHYGVSLDPQVAAAFEKMRNLHDSDKKRADEFNRYYNQATKTLDNSPEPDLATAKQIKVAVDQAEKLMRTLPEQSQFAELKRRYESSTLSLQTKLNAEYSSNIETISNEFHDLRKNTKLTSNEIILRLNKLSLQINTLKQHYPDVPQSLQSQSNILLDLIAKYETKIKSEFEQNDAFNNLVNKISKLNEYKDELQNLVAKYPQHPATLDAEDVIKELDDIKVVADLLHNLASSYSAHASDAKKLHANSTELLSTLNELSSKISVEADQLFPPAQYLKTLSQTNPDAQETIKTTKSFLQNLTQKTVWRWIKKDKWYYLTRKPEKPDRVRSYDYITTFVSENKPVSIYESDFQPEKVPQTTQSDFSLNALKKLDNTDADTVDVICDLIGELVVLEDIDPILRYILLDLFFTDGSAMDSIFNTNFKRCVDIFATSGVDKLTNWMDVDSKNTTPQRNLATVALSRISDIDKIIAKTKTERNQFKNLIGKYNLDFECVGILMRKENQWYCNFKTSISGKTGTLYILRQKLENIITPIPIHTTPNTETQLINNDAFLQCLPVFIKYE
ncbi:MAG: hypothetical protein LBH59_11645 [Planctomycetaceae bacterium]|jgi:hypothetical protein|nr:hypothetical protein [Planctomycetaceae bacterium]